MSEFSVYLQLGFEHILDLQGFDHILFVVVLCAIYLPREWKRILILVTSFTVGHSVTLALAVLDVVRVPSDLIEFLIPLTIVLTAFSNFIVKPAVGLYTEERRPLQRVRYLLAGFFGLIHGLGFSNYLRALLGRSEGIGGKLLAFNLGIELGQLIIVLVVLIVSFIFITLLHTPRREWNLALSGIVAGMAFMLLLDNLFWVAE